MDEVGPSCQCGCIIHLLKSKRRRLLASSTQACPDRSDALWTIQVRILEKKIRAIKIKLKYHRNAGRGGSSNSIYSRLLCIAMSIAEYQGT